MMGNTILMCAVQWFLVFILLCNHHYFLIPEHFHHPRKKFINCLQSFLMSPSSHQLTTNSILSDPLDLPILDISLAWNHIICGLFCLALSLSLIFSKLIHTIASVSTSFILMDESSSIVCIYYLLFIYSSVDGHLTVSTFWLLRILLWTFMYKLLCRHVFYLINFLFCVGV